VWLARAHWHVVISLAAGLVLAIPCFICSILWWYGPESWRRAHGWVMGGQLFKTFALLMIFTYYLWMSRNLTVIYPFTIQACCAHRECVPIYFSS
jgi:hypothetical protein